MHRRLHLTNVPHTDSSRFDTSELESRLRETPGIWPENLARLIEKYSRAEKEPEPEIEPEPETEREPSIDELRAIERMEADRERAGDIDNHIRAIKNKCPSR